jgi:hypothetical protein
LKVGVPPKGRCHSSLQSILAFHRHLQGSGWVPAVGTTKLGMQCWPLGSSLGSHQSTICPLYLFGCRHYRRTPWGAYPIDRCLRSSQNTLHDRLRSLRTRMSRKTPKVGDGTTGGLPCLGGIPRSAGPYAKRTDGYVTTFGLRPGFLQGHPCLGGIPRSAGPYAKRTDGYVTTFGLRPGFLQGHPCLGGIPRSAGPYAKRTDSYVTTFGLRPGFLQGHPCLGGIPRSAGPHAKRTDSYVTTFGLRPGFLQGHPCLGGIPRPVGSYCSSDKTTD